MTTRKKLFISYRSSNSDRVDSIVTRLRSLRDAGQPRYTIWQDKDGIPAGKDWWESIVEAIIDCDVMLFMVSRDSVQNINCRAELNYARRRNRPIIPVVLENEFIYNPISGKNDIDYWKDIPADITDLRAQFLFYEGASFMSRLDIALEQIRQQPQRWRDIPAAMPPDPRPLAEDDDLNRDTAALYDEACDYALRFEFATAERLFQRLVNANDAVFGEDSYQWILLLRDYAQLISLDARDNTRYKVQPQWITYAAQFPLQFTPFFDPKGLQARFGAASAPKPVAVQPLTTPPLTLKAPIQTVTADQQRLLDIMLDWQRYDPAKRAEAGRQLAEIGDPRPGVGLRPDGLPDFAWCEVPGGKAKLGGDKDALNSLPEQVVDLPTFYIAKYPVTYLQFQSFLDAGDGFANSFWWQGLADRQTNTGAQRFQHANHPRENVSWYDSMAYCRWVSSKLGYEITLPTEQQWEKAARGTDGRFFSWGNKYGIGYANVDETKHNQKVGNYYLQSTTSVGLYPQGQSPYEVLDLSGNVWEWTLTDWENNKSIDYSSINLRVSRGGSLGSLHGYVHAASRFAYSPSNRYQDLGFRVVCLHPY
jgi:formylglycine-generating enzyme required for sulfatase activity